MYQSPDTSYLGDVARPDLHSHYQLGPYVFTVYLFRRAAQQKPAVCIGTVAVILIFQDPVRLTYAFGCAYLMFPADPP